MRPGVAPKPLILSVLGGAALFGSCLAVVRLATDERPAVRSAVEEARRIHLGDSPEKVVAVLGTPERRGVTDDGNAWPSLGWVRDGHAQINAAFDASGVRRITVIDWADGGKRTEVAP